jgi:hypothetical protein
MFARCAFFKSFMVFEAFLGKLEERKSAVGVGISYKQADGSGKGTLDTFDFVSGAPSEFSEDSA